MIPALGALALYGAAAAAGLFLASRWIRPLPVRVAVVLAVAPLLLTGRALVTGRVYAPLDILYDADPLGAHRESLGVPPDRSPILGDVVTMVIPQREAVRASLRRGAWPLWNPFVHAGDPLLAMQQPALLHPAAALGLLLPLPQAWTFEETARLFLAFLCGYLFFADLVTPEASRLLGAAAWAFSDYVVFYLGFPHSLAVAPFPLLMLGLRRIARQPDVRAAGVTLLALVLILFAGHPETLLHAVAGAGLYFLFELAGPGRTRRFESLGFALAAGVLALGLAAVLLVPLFETISLTAEHVLRTLFYAHEKRSLALRLVLDRIPAQFAPYAFGVSGHGQTTPGLEVPASYAGSLLLPLAVTGLLGRRRSRLFFPGLLVAVLAVCVKTPAADLLAKLPIFDIAINEYTIFLATFSLGALAVLGAARLQEGDGARTFVLASTGIAVLLAVYLLKSAPRLSSLSMPADYARDRFLLEVLPLVLGGVLVVVFVPGKSAGRAAPVLLVIFLAQRVLETGGTYPSMPSKTFYPPLPVLDKVPRGQPYRFAAVGLSMIPNIPTLYGLEDVRGYEAMTYRPFAQTFPIWCVPQGVWFNRIDAPDRPFLSFLNVRWVLLPAGAAAPGGWPLLAEGDRVRLVENPHALPRAFAPRLYRGDEDTDRRLALLAGIMDFRERGVIDESTAGAWEANGRAEVAIDDYAPDRLVLRVEARESAVVGTSLVNWPGWRVLVDGQPRGLVTYNHAFVGFRVPSGAHRVVLRYMPTGLRIGAGVSAASLAITLLLWWRRSLSARATR